MELHDSGQDQEALYPCDTMGRIEHSILVMIWCLLHPVP